MNYEDELRSKLAAARPTIIEEMPLVVDIHTQEQKILDELDAEFEFGQYDLDESDILRSLKILDILDGYRAVFKYPHALKVFYILARIDVITPKHLHNYTKLPVADFKAVINAMARQKLIFKNESGELELTLDGKSLASRIGIDMYI